MIDKNIQTVVVLGASNKTNRYSYKAIKLLEKYEHNIIPVHPKLDRIDDLAVIAHLSEIKETVDTLTLYIGPERSQPLVNEIVALNPKRVIFNPGTESTFLEEKLLQAGIVYTLDCTLIMLNTNQFSL
jgi:uncharacterized protein